LRFYRGKICQKKTFQSHRCCWLTHSHNTHDWTLILQSVQYVRYRIHIQYTACRKRFKNVKLMIPVERKEHLKCPIHMCLKFYKKKRIASYSNRGKNKTRATCSVPSVLRAKGIVSRDRYFFEGQKIISVVYVFVLMICKSLNSLLNVVMFNFKLYTCFYEITFPASNQWWTMEKILTDKGVWRGFRTNPLHY
jgi:hypothetical protein